MKVGSKIKDPHRLKANLSKSNIECYSFDVFDTCLTRISAYPKDLFLYLGQKLIKCGIWKKSAEDFMRLRVLSESKTRTALKPREIKLEEIYKTLALLCDWNSSTIRDVIEAEIALEIDFLRPVPEVQKAIQKLHNDRHKIIFVSDMYLPDSVIQIALEKNGLWKSGDKLYVSNQSGHQKFRGLFKRVLDQERLSPNRLLHTGDNLHADIKSASAEGIITRHFSDAILNRHEKIIRNTAVPGFENKASLIAASSRLARLRYHENKNAAGKIFWDTGASVIGPAFSVFVYWCLQKAREAGLQRLYFIARDGQILLRIAKKLTPDNDIDCRYLYGSRQAWHLPGITSLNKSDVEWISLHGTRQTLQGLLKRVNVSYHEATQRFDMTFPSHPAEKALSPDSLNRFQRWLLETPMKELIEHKAREARATALGYFAEQGLLDNTIRWGIVDIGWGGNLQISLKRILKAGNAYPSSGITGLYYSVHCAHKDPPEQFFSFLDEAEASEKATQLRSYRCTTELLVRASHGGTMGYKWNGKSHDPILDDQDQVNGFLRGVCEQQQGAEEFISQLLTCASSDILKAFSCAAMFLDFCEHPSRSEAESYGSIPMQWDQIGGGISEVAPKLNLIATLHYIVHTFGKGWLEAMIQRNTGLARALLTARFLLRKFRNKQAKNCFLFSLS